MLANEDAARVADLPDQRPRFGHEQAEVLRGVQVRQLNRLRQVRGDDDAAAVGERLTGDLRPAQPFELVRELHCDLFGQRARRGEQDRRRQHVVLGLRQQVGRGPGRVGAVIGDDQRLGGTVEAVDAHAAEHLALRQRDEQPARADDLVDARHALGAVGQRGDRLRAAQRKEPIHFRHIRRSQDQVVDPRAPGRGADDDFADAGHARRDGGHQQRRGQRRGAAGHVDAGAVERPDQLAQRAVRPGVHPRRHRLLPVKGRDAFGSQIQRRPLFLRQPVIRRAPVGRGHFERALRPPVDPLRPFVQRRVASRPDIPQDARDRLRRRDPRAEDALDAIQHRRRHLLILPLDAAEDGGTGLRRIVDLCNRHRSLLKDVTVRATCYVMPRGAVSPTAEIEWTPESTITSSRSRSRHHVSRITFANASINSRTSPARSR